MDVLATTWITEEKPELIHARTPDPRGRAAFIGYQNQTRQRVSFVDSQ
jgi:hypothetical protein